MLSFLIKRRQKSIAWFLFILFYGEMIGIAYASKRNTYLQIFEKGQGIKSNLHSNRNGIMQEPIISQNGFPIREETAILSLQDNTLKEATSEETIPTPETSFDKEFAGGPGQPEMATFKSVGADNMVNLFTGDFSYNIPLLDVDGYPINIFYNAGPTMDQEASWVGLGWNINPGTINRNMRGLPDDFDGSDKIIKEQSIKTDRTIGVSGSPDKEILGLPSNAWSFGAFYNNKRGLGLEVSANKEFSVHKGIATKNKDEKTGFDTALVVGLTLNSQTGLTPSVGFKAYMNSDDQKARAGLSTSIDFNSRTGLGDLRLSSEASMYEKSKKQGQEDKQVTGDLFSSGISFARTTYTPSINMPLTNFNASLKIKLGKEKKVNTKGTMISGYFSKSGIAKRDRVQVKPAYGYIHYEKANADKDALLDFNRLNDGSFNKKTPIIALPVYTYDVFTISGEGTGGTFRGYRGNMGYVRDLYSRTNSGKVNLSLEFGAGDIIKGGVEVGGVYSATSAGEWGTENALKQTAAFKASDKDIQSGFYFKNPGEKAIIDEQYYANMGEDKLMAPVMGTTSSFLPPLKNPTSTLQSKFQLFTADRKRGAVISVENNATTNKYSYRRERDKRTQVISYLTAFEADRVGLDRYIYSYNKDIVKAGECRLDANYKIPVRRYFERPTGLLGLLAPKAGIDYRKRHHISEITVQEGSQRYIYGLPVYQTYQKQVTFSVEDGVFNVIDAAKGTTTFRPGIDDSEGNSRGKDNLYQAETMQGYAHSFLLTAILSPDYSDLTGDGISDDDLGTAIKFNYTKFGQTSSSPNSWNSFKWRLPVDETANSETSTANHNRGLVTDTKDDKGMYTYGEKELWYTHSVETKNMIAKFTVSPRRDGYGVKNINGKIYTGTGSTVQQKLDKIELYAKADLIKYGTSNAKPVKTVHFTYTYKLCRDYPLFSGDNSLGNGKLTLESIYFTYRNNTHQKNKYRFKYAQQDNTNLKYKPTDIDRWGTYKPASNNAVAPAVISNEDIPYAVQDKTTADANAAVWNLNEILLPSGAKISVDYEADEYAYVQNRRASQMISIAGFGSSPGSTPENKLYGSPLTGINDYHYIFFNTSVPVSNEADIRRLYLQDMKQLLLKLWVKVPSDPYGSGFEPIFVYCNIHDDANSVGVVSGSNGSKFYIRIAKASRGNGSQIMETVYQFLREQLSSKAYPGSDLGEDGGLAQVAKALFAMVNNLTKGIGSFEINARLNKWCKEVDLTRSFARLNNPVYKKRGGGHRVKKVVITDNWKKMINPGGQQDIASYYGQEYDYSSTELIDNHIIENMSTGVASYEPGVGNEENPFREIKQYARHNPLGPTVKGNIELPVAEMFFPSPQVGYSKVSVRSIHSSNNKNNPANNKNIKSGVGMQQTQFYTTKDFPVLSEFTDFDTESRHNVKPGFINQVYNFAERDYLTLLQGFRVVLNDMNGKVKMQATFTEKDEKTPINKTTYYYRTQKIGEDKYKLDNIVPVVGGPDGKISNKLIGKDIEVMNDFREHFTFTHSAQIPLNADFFSMGAWPMLLPSVFRAVFRNEVKFRSATTLKVVNEYGILDSIETNDKGSIAGTKNLVYDAETGNVLVSRTNNEFNKPLYNFNYPAYWANDGMGPAYKNIDAVFSKVLFRNGKLEEGLTTEEIKKYFASGDEIYVSYNSMAGPKDNPGCIGIGSGTACAPLPVSGEFRIWALDITKDTRNLTQDFIFIDRHGQPFNAADVNIRIIRSGRRNMTDASVGSIVSMANPVVLKPDNVTYDKVLISNTTDVVNSGAIEFKEKWKTQDALYYVKDTSVIQDRLTPIETKTINISGSGMLRTHTIGKYRYHCSSCDYYSRNTDNQTYLFARNQSYGPDAGNSRKQDKSWVEFDISGLGASTTIQSAKINLYPHIHSSEMPHKFHYDNPHTGNWPDKHSHSIKDPHFNWKAGISNDFILERMQSKWPMNVGEWGEPYISVSPFARDKVIVTGPVVGTQMQSSNPVLNIEIKDVLQGMIRDYYTKSYVPALRISMVSTSKKRQDTRVCFGLNGIGTINITYIDCSNLLPIGYVPGSGEQVTPCKTAVTYKICKSVFTRDFMNPYVQGILGNWRPLRNHIYYGERREQDPTTPKTNIEKDGIIKDFETFWNLDIANKQITKSNSQKWVWNSQITQYNRKGAELENVDPLQRYNAALFGYNEALPIAMVNNSKLRLSAFDGFEDYFFKDQSCELDCKVNHRHFDTKLNTALLEENIAHTGRYSFKTSASSAATFNIGISADDNTLEPDLLINENKTQTTVPGVDPKGIGLKGSYFNFWPLNWGETASYIREDAVLSVYCRARKNGTRCKDHGNLPEGMRCGDIGLRWQGKVQVQQSGWYYFKSANKMDYSKILVRDTVRFHDGNGNGDLDGNYTHLKQPAPVFLTAGTLHTIDIRWRQSTASGSIDLVWKTLCSNTYVPVPAKNLYPLGKENLADNTVTPNAVCTKVNQVKALNNHLIDGFKLIPDQKMIASVWVKKDVIDCRCPAYTGFTLKLKSAANSNIATLQPKGPIIEGWQQFETIFDVPSETQMDFYIDNSSSNKVLFIDDMRFHPYNANMKSFVYNPYNLKPMAELDENNYASFYEYDDDGTLIRVKKETIKGVKTIQETRSGLQKTITEL